MTDFTNRLEGAKSPYYGKITLGTEPGEIILGESADDHPLHIVQTDVYDVKSMHVHVVKVTDKETGESAYVKRVVAKLDNDHEIDIIDPVAIDANVAELGIDTSKCAACTLPLDALDLVFHDGAAYHRYCLETVGN